jgi:hypothetical protein
MAEHTANPIVESRARMLAPLALFFAACFSMAGAIKFRLMGGDLWFARPMGAPVTCIVLALVGWSAARWFFGAPPSALGTKVLAALVVLLPLMGLLGVVHGATRDAALGNDPTPLGGTLGAMLAGPRAFGLLGPTAAGITLAVLALLGAYLARRMTHGVATSPAHDPRLLMKAMTAQRPAPTAQETEAGVAVLDEEEPPEAADVRGDLFPADAELEPEPEPAVEESTGPIAFMRHDPETEAEAQPEPEPVRTPILSGLVDEAAAEPAATEIVAGSHLFATQLAEAGTETGTRELLDLDEPEPRDDRDDDEEDEPEAEDATILRPPLLEPDEDVTLEPEEEVDDEVEAAAPRAPVAGGPVDEEADDEPEVLAGEAPELAAEWIAAPAAFHMPRGIQAEIETEGDVAELLDVARAVLADAPVVEPVTLEPEAPNPPADRPRFRIKADYVREEQESETPVQPVLFAAPEVVLAAPAEVEAAAPAVESTAAPPEATEAEGAPEPEADAPMVESQLEFSQDSFEAAPATEAEPSGEPRRPRRRMRSAAKDWASWDEKEAERPRLRLVRDADADAAPETPAASGRGDGDVYERAVRLVVDEDRCSVSLLQRNLDVTFGEATALIDRMFKAGVVGPYQPTGRRDVLLGKKGAAASDEG